MFHDRARKIYRNPLLRRELDSELIEQIEKMIKQIHEKVKRNFPLPSDILQEKVVAFEETNNISRSLKRHLDLYLAFHTDRDTFLEAINQTLTPLVDPVNNRPNTPYSVVRQHEGVLGTFNRLVPIRTTTEEQIEKTVTLCLSAFSAQP